MRSMELLDRQDPPVAGAVRAALIELTPVVDVLQSESLDGLDDREVLAVFQDLEAQRRRMPTVDHRLIAELECRAAASFPTMRPVHRTQGLPGHPVPERSALHFRRATASALSTPTAILPNA